MVGTADNIDCVAPVVCGCVGKVNRTAVQRQFNTSDIVDAATKEELRAIAGNEKEIEDRFYAPLKLGTAGLRGVLGVGINLMNLYTRLTLMRKPPRMEWMIM